MKNLLGAGVGMFKVLGVGAGVGVDDKVNRLHSPASYSNKLTSYFLIVFEVGFISGNLASGAVYDKYKRPNMQINISTTVGLFGLIGILLGYVLNSFVVMACFSGIFGLMVGFCLPVYYPILLQHTKVGNEALIMLIVKVQAYFGVWMIEIVTRYILNYSGAVAVFIFMIVMWLCLIVASWFVKPKQKEIVGENEFLLQNDD